MRAALKYGDCGVSGEKKACKKARSEWSVVGSLAWVLVESGLCWSSRLFQCQRSGKYREEINFVVDRSKPITNLIFHNRNWPPDPPTLRR